MKPFQFDCPSCEYRIATNLDDMDRERWTRIRVAHISGYEIRTRIVHAIVADALVPFMVSVHERLHSDLAAESAEHGSFESARSAAIARAQAAMEAAS